MRIGELADRADVTVKAVRYYESLGLLRVERLANGYREYDESQVDVVREIHGLRRLGMPVDETRPFVECLASGSARADDCEGSQDAFRETIASLDARIAELVERRRALAERLGVAASTGAES